MSLIGSSPLGLTFNSSKGGKIPIGSYKRGLIKNNKELYKSIFKNTGFAMYSKGSDEKGEVIGNTENLHNDDIYDTSPISVIRATSKHQSTALSPADFAYLKNVGVFPNNRLMIARRFPAPVGNDLTAINATPLSTLISWVPDGQDFINISFGEEWTDAESSFRGVLNDIGKGVQVSKDNSSAYGDFAAGGFGIAQLPGFMENLQYRVLNQMGLTDVKGTDVLPGGNPNLIREAKRRKTIDNERAGSGLRCKISIKMDVEYELKFIDNIDPTLVYFDIISNILAFGTSKSIFQFNTNFNSSTDNFIKKLVSGDVFAVIKSITLFVNTLIKEIANLADNLLNILKNKDDNNEDQNDKTKDKGILSNLLQSIKDILANTVGKLVEKYKIRIIGIANALTGTPSTPWHVTIGNPKRPLFSSGDMYVTDVDMSMGPILAFNDLPSSIKCSFTLTNARALGAQEIYERFNTGSGRTYIRINDTFEESVVNSPIKEGTQEKTQKSVGTNEFSTRDQFERPNGLTQLQQRQQEQSALNRNNR